MDKSVFLQLVQNPDSISEDQAEALEEMVQQYPYCAVAYTLIAKYQHQKQSMLAEQKIRKAALYSYSRAALKEILGMGSGLTDNTNKLKGTVEEAKDFLSNIKQEIAAFDEKFKEATSEDLDKELASITESYIKPKDYDFGSDNDDEDDEPQQKKSSTQIEQEELINKFLSEDIGFEPEITQDETLGEETHEVKDNVKEVEEWENKTENTFVEEKVEEQGVHEEETNEMDTSTNFFDETLNQLEEEENEPTSVVEETFTNSTEDVTETPALEGEPDVTETDAIILFNEGKLQQAIQVYKTLIKYYPDKKSYYTTQMEIMGFDESEISASQESDDSSVMVEDISTNPLEEEESKSFDEALFNNDSTEVEETVTNEVVNEDVFDIESEEVAKSVDEITTSSDIAINELKADEDFVDTNIDYNPAELVEVTGKKKKEDDKEPESTGGYTELDAMTMFNEGRIQEAIEIYQKLMLQHPEKKAYFEAQIDILES